MPRSLVVFFLILHISNVFFPSTYELKWTLKSAWKKKNQLWIEQEYQQYVTDLFLVAIGSVGF